MAEPQIVDFAARMAQKEKEAELVAAVLKTGGGGGTFDGMDPGTKDYIDAKTEATRAQNDARFAEVLGEMKAIGARVDVMGATLGAEISKLRSDIGTEIGGLTARINVLEKTTISKLQVWGAVFTGSVAVVGLILAALAYGGDRFDGGVSIAEQMRAQSERDAAQDAKMNEVFTRLDAAVDRLATPAPDQTEATPGE